MSPAEVGDGGARGRGAEWGSRGIDLSRDRVHFPVTTGTSHACHSPLCISPSGPCSLCGESVGLFLCHCNWGQKIDFLARWTERTTEDSPQAAGVLVGGSELTASSPCGWFAGIGCSGEMARDSRSDRGVSFLSFVAPSRSPQPGSCTSVLGCVCEASYTSFLTHRVRSLEGHNQWLYPHSCASSTPSGSRACVSPRADLSTPAVPASPPPPASAATHGLPVSCVEAAVRAQDTRPVSAGF